MNSLKILDLNLRSVNLTDNVKSSYPLLLTLYSSHFFCDFKLIRICDVSKPNDNKDSLMQYNNYMTLYYDNGVSYQVYQLSLYFQAHRRVKVSNVLTYYLMNNIY